MVSKCSSLLIPLREQPWHSHWAVFFKWTNLDFLLNFEMFPGFNFKSLFWRELRVIDPLVVQPFCPLCPVCEWPVLSSVSVSLLQGCISCISPAGVHILPASYRGAYLHILILLQGYIFCIPPAGVCILHLSCRGAHLLEICTPASCCLFRPLMVHAQNIALVERV